MFHHCNIVCVIQANKTNEIRSNVAIRVFPSSPVFDLMLQKKYLEFNAVSKRRHKWLRVYLEFAISNQTTNSGASS